MCFIIFNYKYLLKGAYWNTAYSRATSESGGLPSMTHAAKTAITNISKETASKFISIFRVTNGL